MNRRRDDTSGSDRLPMVAAGIILLVASCATLGVSLGSGARVLDDRATPAPLPALVIDLNSATVGELTLLPMIGPARAEAIVRDRVERGPFAQADDLQRVRGIGPAITERVRPFVTVGARPPASRELD